MPLVDLSHRISAGMPVYPGTEPLSIVTAARHANDGFEERRIAISSHTGTHMDAPVHVIPGGKSLDHFPIDHFMGPAVVIDLTAVRSLRIRIADLKPHHDLLISSDYVLLSTGWDRYWDQPGYFARFPVLDPEAASWLCNFAPKGLGVDAPSFDRDDSTDYPIHRLFLSRDILLIENLTNLKKLQHLPFTLSCFPLPIQQADGSPVRVVAIVP